MDPLFFLIFMHGLNGLKVSMSLGSPQSFDKSDLSIPPIGRGFFFLSRSPTSVTSFGPRQNWRVGNVRW